MFCTFCLSPTCDVHGHSGVIIASGFLVSPTLEVAVHLGGPDPLLSPHLWFNEVDVWIRSHLGKPAESEAEPG